MDSILEHWHDIAYGVLAVIFVTIYVLHLLPNVKLSGAMEEILHKETLLIVLLVFVAITAIRVEKVSDQVKVGTEEIVGSLSDVLKSEGLARVQPVDGMDELFAQLNRARMRSSRDIRMLRLWGESGEDLSSRSRQAALWYEEMDQWLKASPGRLLYRIIGVHGPESEEVFLSQCRQAAGSGNKVIRRIEGILRDPDLSIVIFDQWEVFLIVNPTGDLVEATNAYRVEDDGFAKFMVDLFSALMARAEKCP